MPAVAFAGCFTTGHGCWPPTIIFKPTDAVSGALSGVLISLIPVAKFGDSTVPHGCSIPKSCAVHSGICSGFNSVLIGLKPMQTLGMPITCCLGAVGFDFIAAGNPQVLSGGF